ncbi:MAG: DUF1028 domain-containing protein [Thermoanaerobaculia bacterium]
MLWRPIALILMLAAVPAVADPLVHTYSIVARDPVTGDLGVAVQSHWFSVGSVVPWAEAGVGAVATQASVDPSYGPLGLELMRSGKSAKQALESLLASDPQSAFRQVAMVDSQGRVAAHTGSSTIPAAGDSQGDGFSVQANLMRNDRIWPAMAAAFESAGGDLAERMLAALDAAEAAGGDIRGRQSAALLIVKAKSSGSPWADRIFDLRIEDHPEPLAELRRLVRLQRAYNHMNRGDALAAEEKWEEAMKEYRAGAELAPEIEELPYWVAVTLFTIGKEAEALPIFRDVFARNRDWVELTRRLPAIGFLPADPAALERILATAGPDTR